MLPDTLLYRNTKINNKDKASTFANFFSNKVNSIVTEATINPNVFNGSKINKLQFNPFNV